MKTSKCLICKKRFRVQDWKKGKERENCFTCISLIKWCDYWTTMLNTELSRQSKPGKIIVYWLYE